MATQADSELDSLGGRAAPTATYWTVSSRKDLHAPWAAGLRRCRSEGPTWDQPDGRGLSGHKPHHWLTLCMAETNTALQIGYIQIEITNNNNKQSTCSHTGWKGPGPRAAERLGSAEPLSWTGRAPTHFPPHGSFPSQRKRSSFPASALLPRATRASPDRRVPPAPQATPRTHPWPAWLWSPWDSQSCPQGIAGNIRLPFHKESLSAGECSGLDPSSPGN